jgi:hypothetical protein
MKKELCALLAWSALLSAEAGFPPLYIANVTFSPNGCGDGATFNVQVIASGGAPDANGFYTYELAGQPTQVTKVAQFNNILGGDVELRLRVTDSTNNVVSTQLVALPSNSDSISINVDSLPLGNVPGCITVSVTNPGGTPVVFAAGSQEDPTTSTATQAPFSRTFSVFPSAELFVGARTESDCDGDSLGGAAVFSLPFPQGQANAIKTYLFSKYCSCTLRTDTIPVLR